MKILNIKKLMAIVIFSSSFSSLAANPPLQFEIRGSFDEVVPPCTLTSSSSFNLPFGTIPIYVNVGYETQPESVNISYQCEQDVDVKIHFSNSAHQISNVAYQTTADHIGVKAKINGEVVKPNEKIEFKSRAGLSTLPIEISLLRLAETKGSGGNYAFNLTGVIETDYN
ncbi:hypothetical protein ACBQ54_18320 [Providencia vermicola]|uniref:hypothetical protein n=1 Tax=Providencia vermicola TaxID=333965 RepID=UPI002AB37EDE|nr:hypothetical protein [Providencia stuartii]